MRFLVKCLMSLAVPVTSVVSFLCYEVHDKLSGELSGDFPVS